MSNPPPPSDPGQDPQQPTGGEPGQPTGGQPYSGSSYGDPSEPQSGQPYGSQPYGSQPYGSQPPPPGQYGAPGGYPQQPQGSSPLAITALVTGILGLLLSCFCYFIPVLPIAAVVTGVLGRKQVREQGDRYKGGPLATWGLWLGVAGLVISLILIVLVVAVGMNTGWTFESDFS